MDANYLPGRCVPIPEEWQDHRDVGPSAYNGSRAARERVHGTPGILELVPSERRHTDRWPLHFFARRGDAAHYEPLFAQRTHGWPHRFGPSSRCRARCGRWRACSRSRFGRKPAFLIDMTIITIGALISALATAPQWVLIGQFIVGAGIGIDFPVSSSYVSETAPKQDRSRMVVATIALQSVGMLLGAVVAIAILWQRSNASDWRLIVGATAAVAFLFLLLRLWLPESPRWLKQHEQGKTVTGGAATASPSPGFAVLLSRPYRTRTMLVSLPWFLMDVATYGVGLFTPVILGAIRSSSKTTGPLAAEFANAQGSGAIDLFLLFGFLVGLWAVPRFGRIHMQVIGFVGMTIGMLILVAPELATGGAAAHVW